MTDEEKLKIFDMLFAEVDQLVDVQTLERFKAASIEQLEDLIEERKTDIYEAEEEIKSWEAEIRKYDDPSFLKAQYIKNNVQMLANTVWA